MMSEKSRGGPPLLQYVSGENGSQLATEMTAAKISSNGFTHRKFSWMRRMLLMLPYWMIVRGRRSIWLEGEAGQSSILMRRPSLWRLRGWMASHIRCSGHDMDVRYGGYVLYRGLSL